MVGALEESLQPLVSPASKFARNFNASPFIGSYSVPGFFTRFWYETGTAALGPRHVMQTQKGRPKALFSIFDSGTFTAPQAPRSAAAAPQSAPAPGPAPGVRARSSASASCNVSSVGPASWGCGVKPAWIWARSLSAISLIVTALHQRRPRLRTGQHAWAVSKSSIVGASASTIDSATRSTTVGSVPRTSPAAPRPSAAFVEIGLRSHRK